MRQTVSEWEWVLVPTLWESESESEWESELEGRKSQPGKCFPVDKYFDHRTCMDPSQSLLLGCTSEDTYPQ